MLIYVIPAVLSAAVAMAFWRKPARDFDGLARRLGAVFLFAWLAVYTWHGLWSVGVKSANDNVLILALSLSFFSAIAWIPAAFLVSLFKRGKT